MIDKETPRQAFLRGVRTAAELASEYNGVTNHPYDLGDCILGKLNLLGKRRPRRNRRRPNAMERP